MRHSFIRILLVAASICVAITAFAVVPGTINYQGRLLSTTGDPVADATYSIRFGIYNAATVGSVLWAETLSVTTSSGLFSAVLGNVHPIPATVFPGTDRWLGIGIGTDVELSPRTKLTSAAYAQKALKADTALNIIDGSIVNADISASANIAASKIAGTAATLSASNAFTGSSNSFSNGLWVGPDNELLLNGTKLAFREGGYYRWRLYDSTGGQLRLKQVYDQNNILVNREVMRIDYDGNFGIGEAADSRTRLTVVNIDSTTSWFRGLHAWAYNVANGNAYGIHSQATCAAPGGEQEAYGVSGWAESDGTIRTGVYGRADVAHTSWTTGASYGLYGDAKRGATAYGVYGTASSATTNYAGYFSGNARVTGTLTKGAGAFIIDHPLDPEHKYLQHSFVESPDMKNVYDGNVVTDANGYAEVQLPNYFEALNRDFRYQLTVVGQFAQAIVAEKISNNRFAIRTDKPGVEVSWQVTGIRKDPYAEANRIQVETDKPADQQGKYLHTEAYHQPIEKSVDYENLKLGKDTQRDLDAGTKQ